MELPTFEDRFRYLKLEGEVGKDTFGFDRYLNQRFYQSEEWASVRREVIIRDNGCDLAIEDRPIFGKIVVHHMNPITVVDLADFNDFVMNPEYLITTFMQTHNAIHYGDESILENSTFVERRKDDTCLWRN